MAALESDAPRPVLITGASGRVGRMLTAAWRRRYGLILVDQRDTPGHAGLRVVRGDVSCLRVVRPLCEGADTVVHLAGVPSPTSVWSEIRRHNVRSTWAVLRAARDAGCRRLVFASSTMIFAEPARPYSRGKLLAEQLARRYADESSLSVLCLRLGRVLSARDPALAPGAWYLPRVLMEEDLVAAFTLAVEAPAAVHYGIFTVISANRESEFDITETRARLGYSPRMDAFALADRRRLTPRQVMRRAKAWLKGQR